MIFITDPKEINRNSVYVLYFYAPWMPFNKKMVTMINNIEEKYKKVTFYGINTDIFKDICKKYEVNSIPYIIVYKNYNQLHRIEGLILTSALKKIFSDIYKS